MCGWVRGEKWSGGGSQEGGKEGRDVFTECGRGGGSHFEKSGVSGGGNRVCGA